MTIKMTKGVHNTFILFGLLLNILIPAALHAQSGDDDNQPSRFSYGLNVGFYFANNQTANFYNGNPTNENSINIIFQNKYIVNEIQNNLGYVLDTVTPYVLPAKMRYNPAVSVGFYARYELSKEMGIFAQFNYSKLIASDVVLINLHLPQNYSFDPTYKECTIYGTEKRYNIDLGISRIFPLQQIMNLCVEMGININNTTVIDNKVRIAEKDYSIVNYYGSQSYIPGTQQTTYNVVQGGIGFGVFTSGILKFQFNEKMSLDPGLTFYWQQINLGKYDGFKPAFSPFVRFVFKV